MTGGDAPRITILENGPYLVRGGIPLTDAAGTRLQAKEPYALCRCGGSSSKPFCDGTHKRNGFVGEEAADRGPIAARRIAYRASGIVVYDDRSVCSHAGHCTEGLPAVFRSKADPWIDPGGATVEEIVEAVRRCPSGALSYALGDSAEPAEESRSLGITASKDGPYHVAGGVPLLSAGGAPYELRQRYALCRCGHSRNKPFCDGAHWKVGFKAA